MDSDRHRVNLATKPGSSLATRRVKVAVGVIVAFVVIFALLYVLGGSS